MPHILVSGTDMNKQIEYINIHAEINFKPETFHSLKMQIKMDELKEKLEAVVEEYFDIIESEDYTNHEYNSRMEDY